MRPVRSTTGATLAALMMDMKARDTIARRRSQAMSRTLVVRPVVDSLALAESSSVIDLGCGAGSWSLEFACRGHRVVSVDRRADALDWVRAQAAYFHVAIDCVQADFTTFAIPRTFDVVVQIYTGVVSLAPAARFAAKKAAVLWQEGHDPTVNEMIAFGLRTERDFAAPRGLQLVRRV